METNSIDETPTQAEHMANPEMRLEPAIKVAGWTCLKHSAAPSPLDHYTHKTEHGNNHHEDEDEKNDGDLIVALDTAGATGICEWEGCDQIFKGPESSALLHYHIVNEHMGKPGETKTYDPKRRWAACTYRGKIRRYLLSNIITHVPEYKPLACQDCGWSFQRESNLRMHQKSCKKK